MNEDPRCCGTGTCIINPEGVCWCGQVWDGSREQWKKNQKEKQELLDTIKNSDELTTK